MASSSPHPKKRDGDSKRSRKTVSDSESDSEEYVKPQPANPNSPLEKSATTLLKEIKATFDFKGPKDFQKIRILGKGGVGRVYLVQLKDTDKLFAMKVLKQEEMISRNKVRVKTKPFGAHKSGCKVLFFLVEISFPKSKNFQTFFFPETSC